MSRAYSVPRGRLAGLRRGKQLYSRIIEGRPELRIFDRREGDCFTSIKTCKSGIDAVFSCHDRGRIQALQATPDTSQISVAVVAGSTSWTKTFVSATSCCNPNVNSITWPFVPL